MKIKFVRREIPSQNCTLPDDLHPVLQRIYRARRICSPDDLDYSLKHLHSFESLTAIGDAVKLLTQSLMQQQRVLIIGDFDADGATSTALAVKALKMFGFQQVDYLVPNRFEYGYGLTPEIVAAAADFQPELIITVDNGISSIEGVNAAKSRGIQVLVTDHHLPGAALPCADAIINPNNRDDLFPSNALAGVGTIFYVMLALRTHLRQSGYFKDVNIEEPNLADLLDLVALGTVADVVPLDRNNRILVSQGLARIRAGKCCAGIRALIKLANRNANQLVASDLAFAIGPRLNAAGRIEDMSIGIECLLSDDEAKALRLAAKLDDLNRERKEIEADMKEQALQIIEELQVGEDTELPLGLCLYDRDWHQGVIGILASRIKDKFHRPVVAFADGGIDAATGLTLIKGSARSIHGVHIRDVLDTVATRNPQLLHKFGGHAMAAGMSIWQKDFEAFSKAFNEEVDRHIDRDCLHNIILTDGELHENELTLELAQQLKQGGPWGQEFPEPLFDGEFEVLQRRLVGERHLKFLLQTPGGGAQLTAMIFFISDPFWLQDARRLHLAYRLDINEYNGQRSLQLIVQHAQALH